MYACAYPNCKNTLRDKNLSFYSFPLEDKAILEKWVAALKRENFKPTDDAFLCSNHFNSEDILEGGILKNNAIPRTYKTLADLTDFDICRVCGIILETSMNDIFDEDLEICEQISLCLPIVVNLTDPLPQTICDECLSQLNIATALMKKCLAAEEKFKPLLEQEIRKKSEPMDPLPLNGPIACEVCKVHFDDMSLFDEHMAEHEEDAQHIADIDTVPYIACTTCGHIFSNQKTYTEHKENTLLSCDKCFESLNNRCTSYTHKCPRVKCTVCNASVMSEEFLQMHIAKYHPTALKTENEKPARRYQPSTLKSKPRKKIGRSGKLELYHCNICNINFHSNKQLRDHCVEYHGTSNVLWICKWCGKSMTTKVSLQIHERIHYDQKPYICQWCGNGYRSRANLNQHQVIHTGIRNHVCTRCGKRFSRKAFLRIHMRVHSGERPYPCNLCGQRFTQLGDMKRHRNRHENPHVPAYPSDKVYICDFCGEKFLHLYNLKRHRYLHSKEAKTDDNEENVIIELSSADELATDKTQKPENECA